MSTRRILLVLGVLLLTGCAPAGTPSGPGVSGLLLDEEERPLPWELVMACRPEVCFYANTDAEGRFVFRIDRSGRVLIKTAEVLTASPRRAPLMAPVSVDAGAFLELGRLYVPFLPEGSLLPGSEGPVTVDLGDGLSMDLIPEALDLPPGRTRTGVAARRLPASQAPPYPGIGREEILAVYALHPFAATSEIPIGVRIESALPSGTPVAFRTIDEVDGSLSSPVPGIADGAFLATEPGRGIHRLTHLLVLRQ